MESIPALMMLAVFILSSAFGIILFIFVCKFIIMTPKHLERIAEALEENNRIQSQRNHYQQSSNNPNYVDRGYTESINYNDVIGPH